MDGASALLHQANILVVDDNPDNLQMIAEVLSEQGYTVWLACNGDEALESIQSNRPDLILLDIMLPDMDGYAICEILKRAEQTRDIPIIFISALHEIFDKVKAFSVGGIDYITKPFQAEEVLARVVTHLSLHRMRQQLQAQNVQLQAEIAERQRTEEAYRSLVDHSLQGFGIMQDGRIVFANATAERITGYTLEEIQAMGAAHLDIMVHPADQVRLQSYHQDRMQGQPAPMHYAYRLIRKDGTLCWLDNHAVPIQYQGRTAVQLSFVDITERRQAEEEVRKLQQAVEQSPSSIMVTDNTGRIEYINPRFTYLTGYTLEEVRGHNPRFLKSGLTSPETYQELWRTITTGREWRGEFCNTKKNGETYWEWASVSPIYDDAGQITHFVAVKEEITARKRMEEELRERETLFRMTFDQSPIGAAMVGLDYRFLRVNAMLCQITGYAPEELLTFDFPAITHPDDLEADVVATHQLVAGSIDYHTIDKRYIRKDGQIVWAHLFSRLVHDAQGNPLYFLALIEDITQRKRVEEAYRNLVDHSLQGLIILQDGYAVFANAAMEQIHGYPPEELLAMSPDEILDLIHPDDLPWVQERMQELLSGYPIAPRNEHRIVRKDGAIRWVEVYSAIIAFHGKSALQLAFIDITERKQAESQLLQQQQALAMLRERERLARELHDSLGQVLGYVNVQTQTVRDLLSTGQTALADMYLERLYSITQETQGDIRAFILGVRAGGTRDRDTFFRSVERYLEHYEHIYGLKTSLTIAPALVAHSFAPAVEAHLVRIIQEALTNVQKHAQASTVYVTFGRLPDQIQLLIADDGCGFALTRVPHAPDDAPTSQGYGLHSMRERVREIGGTLQIDTIPGRGTRVQVGIPLHPPDALLLQGLKVMLVDDQPLFLEGMQNMLAARGVAVIATARNGLEALHQARTHRPDVILMDVEMPVCNGLEATRRIKAELPETQIVMLTVSAEDEHLFESIKSGASGYLLKSLDADDFFTLLAGLEQNEVALAPGMAKKILQEFARLDQSAVGRGAHEQALVHAESHTEAAAPLTQMQRDVLALVAHGLTYREVGQRVGYSERSVKNFMSEIIKQLHLRNRADAIAYARKAGLDRESSVP